MVVRGRLAFDDQGRLVEIAEDAADPTNPQASEIDPVEFEELIAQTARAQELDAGQLLSSLDAAGYDISNVGAFDSQSVSTGDVSGVLYIGDSDTPNADINAAPAGATVLADPSTPIQTDGLFNIDVADLTIIGLNLALNDAANENVLQVRADGVTLVRPRIDGNKANQSPTGQIHGIFTVGQNDVTLVEPVVRNTHDNGITNFAPDAVNQTVVRGLVENAGREGIRMGGDDLTVSARIINAGSRTQAGGAVPRAGANQEWDVVVDGTTDSGVTITGAADGARISGVSKNNANNGLETEDAAVVENITVSDFEAHDNGAHGIQSRTQIEGEGLDLHHNGEAGAKLNGQDGAIDFCYLSGRSWANGQNSTPAEPYGVSGTGTVTDVEVDMRVFDPQGTQTQTTGVNTSGSCDYWDLAHSNLRDMATAFNLVGANNSTSDATV